MMIAQPCANANNFYLGSQKYVLTFNCVSIKKQNNKIVKGNICTLAYPRLKQICKSMY